jgi:hypothetical protein
MGVNMTLPESQKWSSEQIWGYVLSTLQMDMSKANFDTWVKSAEVRSFDGEIFVVGCHNDYGREWLESRLKTTIQRMITGAINHPVVVEFKVFNWDYIKPEEQDAKVDVPIEGQAIDGELAELAPVFASLRDALIEPDRVVKLPTYFLRWLPYVGAKTIFELMGLWQEYYLNSKGKQPRAGEKVSTRIEKIGLWSGVSRAQLFRDMEEGQPLSWFINKIETDYEMDRKTGRAKKSSNKYALYGVPLTPGDAEDLSTFLLQNGIRENPHQALRIALQVQPGEILQYPYRQPSESFKIMVPHRKTIQDVISALIGRRLDEELSDLVDQLADRLLGTGDFILVRWYFLKHWLPILGHNPAMLVILFRNLCYFNDETGEIRDEVWNVNGYEEIATRLGIDNHRQVCQWFPAVFGRGVPSEDHTEKTDRENERRQRIKDSLAAFLERTDYRSTGQSGYAWLFRVQRMDPLIPDHETVKHAAAYLFAQAEEQQVLTDLYSFLDWLPNDCFETLKKDPMLVLRLSKIGNDCFETLEILFNDCFEMVKTLPNACFETLLKILKAFKDSQKDKDSTTNQDSLCFRQSLPKEGADGRDIFQEWNLESLLANVNPQNRDVLLRQEKNPIPFLSWIIYGIATTTIQNPVSLAISKLKAAPNHSAGGVFERLASIPADQFIKNMEREMSYWGPSDTDWRTVFRSVDLERKQMLIDILGISVHQAGE